MHPLEQTVLFQPRRADTSRLLGNPFGLCLSAPVSRSSLSSAPYVPGVAPVTDESFAHSSPGRLTGSHSLHVPKGSTLIRGGAVHWSGRAKGGVWTGVGQIVTTRVGLC